MAGEQPSPGAICSSWTARSASIRFPASTSTQGRVAHFAQEGWVDAPELVAQLLDAAQRQGATLRAGCSVAELGTDEGSEIPQRLVEELARRAAALVPGLAGASVADARIGVRVMPADGYPSVGAVAELPGYYEAVTRSGVTLGPLIGRLLAELILTEGIDPLLAPYSPDQFPPRPEFRDPATT